MVQVRATLSFRISLGLSLVLAFWLCVRDSFSVRIRL